jgi:hypothetical protein
MASRIAGKTTGLPQLKRASRNHWKTLREKSCQSPSTTTQRSLSATVTTYLSFDKVWPMTPTDTNIWEDVLWDDLLPAIEEGQVIPIVGRDLLVVETDAGPRMFHRLLAERLAAELKIPADRLPAEFETNDVVCAYKEFHGDPLAVRPQLVLRIIKDMKVQVPEPLRLLAEIPNFRLFISTTFDTLLEEAIAAVRGRKPVVVAYPPASNLIDYDGSLLEDDASSLVFQILGRVSVSSTFAVTEGQMLEQMHDFMAGEGRPKKLIVKLQQSHLLILGVGFPDWLARFLLRLSRARPLWDSRTITEVIADGRCMQPEFAQFLSRFSPQQTRIFTEGSPVDFVVELHRRWFERHPKTAPTVRQAGSSTEKPTNMTSGSIFISYAHEDEKAAFRIADELTASGLEVWIDRRLNPGDDFQNVIAQYIRDCCAFVPLLSLNTQNDSPRWFRKEWAQAIQIASSYFGTESNFLFPVVIDATPSNDLVEFRRNLFGRTAVRALGGGVPSELVGQLDTAQKAYRKRNTRQ